MARQQNGSTLGRFQQKVVTMYISSKNKVVSCSFKLLKTCIKICLHVCRTEALKLSFQEMMVEHG